MELIPFVVGPLIATFGFFFWRNKRKTSVALIFTGTSTLVVMIWSFIYLVSVGYLVLSPSCNQKLANHYGVTIYKYRGTSCVANVNGEVVDLFQLWDKDYTLSGKDPLGKER
ncbi:hypothetical protein LCGC14_0429500 [marine sediment metagenome]|uniref:Uncharacterized protein n=1 Tax=marine sediment metagenome TaxID=412755 RepID=A0A0F9SUH2_9ZZZZ